MDNQSNLINLPILIINKILSNLNLRDRYKLKLICKEWKYLIERHIQIRLIICETDYIFKTKFNDYDILVINRDLDYFSLFNLKAIQNLKYLYIDYIERNSINRWNQINFDSINYLQELRIIKMKNLELKLTYLYLPRLISLDIENSYIYIDKLNLNCAKLKNLIFKCSGYFDFQFEYPESILFLRTDFMDDEFFKFKNLEHLITERFDDRIAFKFSKLKKLELLTMPDSLDNPIIELIKRNKNLEIFINGFKYPDHINLFANEWDTAYIFLDLNKSKLILDNYSNLKSKIYCKTYLKYSDEIPDFISDHFTNIQAIFVVGKINQLNLIKLLKNCKTFNHLFLETNSLNQNFYDQLPTFKSIKNLKISTHNKGIKFNFITQIGHLLEFYLLYHRIPIKSIIETLKTNKIFKQFHFSVFEEINDTQYIDQLYIYLAHYSSDFRLTRIEDNKIQIYGKKEEEKDLNDLENYLKQNNLFNKYLVDK